MRIVELTHEADVVTLRISSDSAALTPKSIVWRLARLIPGCNELGIRLVDLLATLERHSNDDGTLAPSVPNSSVVEAGQILVVNVGQNAVLLFCPNYGRTPPMRPGLFSVAPGASPERVEPPWAECGPAGARCDGLDTLKTGFSEYTGIRLKLSAKRGDALVLNPPVGFSASTCSNR